jgi:hypothetical protein
MTVAPSIRWRSFSLHKEGNKPEEYEDAFAGNPKSGRFAIADGASESSFACLWAQLLVEGFVASRERRTTGGWFTPLQRRWVEAVDHLELDWFGEEKRQLGAFATFLGLSLKKPKGDSDGRWKALAVGDCCVFQIRDDSLHRAFPVSRSIDFGNRPPLVGSRWVPNQRDNPLCHANQTIGSWKTGDHFYLMTDAVARWFLRRQEKQRKPWHSLLRRLAKRNPTAALTAYFERLRSRQELKNDDLTLVMVEL